MNTKLTNSFFAIYTLGFLTTPVLANEIELSLGEQLIDLRLTSDYEQDFIGRLAYMHSDDNDINTDMLSYTFATRGMVDQFNVTLAAKAFLLDAENQDGYGIAIGGGASTEIIEKLTVGGELYYSPDIITGGDTENTLEIDGRVSYQLIENGAIFAGYRFIELDTDVGDFEVYDDLYLGIKFTF